MWSSKNLNNVSKPIMTVWNAYLHEAKSLMQNSGKIFYPNSNLSYTNYVWYMTIQILKPHAFFYIGS
jgi:hypothetical protein